MFSNMLLIHGNSIIDKSGYWVLYEENTKYNFALGLVCFYDLIYGTDLCFQVCVLMSQLRYCHLFTKQMY